MDHHFRFALCVLPDTGDGTEYVHHFRKTEKADVPILRNQIHRIARHLHWSVLLHLCRHHVFRQKASGKECGTVFRKKIANSLVLVRYRST